MKTLANFAVKAATWNAARYEQKFDYNFTYNLIKEELDEFSSATELVEQVDALADICFVAAGALWKMNLNFDQQTFESFYNFYMLDDAPIKESLTNALHVGLNFPGIYTHACTFHQTIATAFDILAYKLNSQEAAIEALHIIADSNSTKSVKNIPTGAKYSDEGKGSEYIPPTAALTQLIAGIANEIKH